MTRDLALTLAEIYVGQSGKSDEDIGTARAFLRQQSDEDLFDFVRAIVNVSDSNTPERVKETARQLAQLRTKSATKNVIHCTHPADAILRYLDDDVWVEYCNHCHTHL